MLLEQRVLTAKNDREQMNSLIKEYVPFISSCAFKATGRPIRSGDDELAIAMSAFAEAIVSYEKGRGQFLTLASQVIHRRLIDYSRRQIHRKSEIPFSALSSDDGDGSVLFDVVDEKQLLVAPIRGEINALTQELAAFNIGFLDLVQDSPKSSKTKTSCAAAINYILDNPDVYSRMMRMKTLPITDVSTNSMMPHKILERHRKYIIAVVEILSNDYPYLSEYVAFIRGGTSK